VDVGDPVRLSSILAGLRVTSKKEVLMMLAREVATRTGLHELAIFNALLERERLGSTGVGAGIAIPHARLPNLDRPCSVFARLDRPIAFDSIDERPVDLVFLVLSPEMAGGDHLKFLSRISRLFRDQALCRALRRTSDTALLRSLLNNHIGQIAA
jgi:PTS system nitrogen regulatory IIA component